MTAQYLQEPERAPETRAQPSSAKRDSDIQQGVRFGMLVIGAVLAAIGLRRRSIAGLLVFLLGASVIGRAIRDPQPVSPSMKPTIERLWQRGTALRSTAPVTMEHSITISESPEKLADVLREPETLDRIVGRFAEVTRSGEDRYHWYVHGPLTQQLTWETELVTDTPGKRLRWKTTDDTTLLTDWIMDFHPAPGDRGTVVMLLLRFEPPDGTGSQLVLDWLDTIPETLVQIVLQRLKSLVETGEIPTLERNPSARGTGDFV